MTTKILCIDDEPNILDGYRRSLRKQFEIDTAPGGPEGLRKMEEDGPYAVVVTDMRMPGMDGIAFLKRAQSLAPDTVRMMLTGNADQQTAAEAVNEGRIFRFLNKPCPPEDLAHALTAGLEQYRLITAEKELLEKTLGGTIRMLVELLTMVDPTLFGRAQSLRQSMRQMTIALRADGNLPEGTQIWAMDLAALLSQIGAVAVPSSVVRKVELGAPLSSQEQAIWQRVPETGWRMLRNIPRLEPVAEIVRYQHKHFDGGGFPSDSVFGAGIPYGARVLKVLLDLTEMEAKKLTRAGALVTMQRQAARYDPRILGVAARSLGARQEMEPPRVPSEAIPLKALRCGHVLAEDVEALDGVVLLTAGRHVTEMLLEKLENYAALAGVKEPIYIESRSGLVSP